MKKVLMATLLVLFAAAPAGAADGVVSVASASGVKETADRLEGILREKGMTIFGRIDHAAAAAKVGVDLRETQLLIFGNPKAGSPLMACSQTAAIDLPQKALVWKDAGGKVWVSYNDPRYLERRHGIAGCEEALARVEKALAGIAAAGAGN